MVTRLHLNKTEQVTARVFQAILHGRYGPGDVVPSERDMQALAKASRITIRRAYARLVAAGVLERRHGSGTYVASQRRGAVEQGGSVGLLASIRFRFGGQFVEALEHAVRRSGQLLVLRLTDLDRQEEEAAAVELVSHQVRNLVIWPSRTQFAASTFARLRVLGVNMVFFDIMVPGPYADFVGLDNAHAIQSLLAAAVARGRRSFLFVTHGGAPADSDRQREAAFIRRCEALRLPHRVVAVPWLGDIDGVLRQNARAWFGTGAGLGVLCVNDDVALKVRAVAGRPAGVYGIDGRPEAVAAGIVTYRQPVDRMAKTALALIQRQQQLGPAWTARRVFCRGAIVPA